jgi:hypothetical protein
MQAANQTTFQHHPGCGSSQSLVVLSYLAQLVFLHSLGPCSTESPFRAFLVPARLGLVTGADLNRAKSLCDLLFSGAAKAGAGFRRKKRVFFPINRKKNSA